MLKHLFLSDNRLLDHGLMSHPENAGRLEAVFEAFEESPYSDFLSRSFHRFALEKELAYVHSRDYINEVLSLEGKEAYLDPETILTPGSVKSALLAAGIGLELVEQIVEGKIQNGFALVRPPGHHARPSAGMGFCLFNNIAIAAKRALAIGVKRILILDWDVHHGNGTQEAFYEDDRVLFIDLHQENLFPVQSGLWNETGNGAGQGFTVNVPLPAGCGDEDYFYVLDVLVKPLAKRFRPELILVSAGFDAHESDPLGFMKVTTKGFSLLSQKAKNLAEGLCGGKLAFFLEGGYNPFFLSKNVMECVKVLIQDSVSSKEEIKPVSKKIERLLKEIYEHHFNRTENKAI